MAPLTDKKVLILGGSSGVGFGVAKLALAEGANVIIASSNASKLQDAAGRLGHPKHVTSHVIDMKEEASFEALFTAVGKAGDDIVRATIGFPNLNIAAAKATLFDVRFWGLVIAAQYAAKGYVTESLTCTTGSNERRPVKGMAIATGGAGSLPSSTRGFALDLAPLRVNCVAVGLVDTEMHQRMPAQQREMIMRHTAQKLPVKHVATSEEVAEAYIFAMKCTYFTGQTLHVEGGALLV